MVTMTKNNIVVETRNLKKNYRLGEVEVHALKGINMKIKRGEFVTIMGPSGSGKTTLLNMIGALDRPTEGSVFIDNIDLIKMNDEELTQLRRAKVGFVFQFYNLIPVLSAFENVELPMVIKGITSKEREKRAIDLLSLVGLSMRLNHRPDELSGGERQRVAIARALANSPSIILADEVTGDLDTNTGNEIVEMLKKLNREKGQTLILVTHDSEIAKKAERILSIKDGLIASEEILN